MNVRRRSYRGAAIAALLLATPLVASCGFTAPTTQVYNPGAGVSNQDGMVDALNVLVVSASDGTGTVVAGLVNKDQVEDDALAGVAAADGQVQVQLGGPTEIPAGELLDIADDGGVTISGDPVQPGNYVTLTFSFDRAASATVDAPVVEYAEDGPYKDVPVE